MQGGSIVTVIRSSHPISSSSFANPHCCSRMKLLQITLMMVISAVHILSASCVLQVASSSMLAARLERARVNVSGLALVGAALHKWELPSSSSNNGTNLCSEGKLLPEAYLLGAPRSASSTFSYDLVRAGVKVASGVNASIVDEALASGRWAGSGAKEWHFFEHWAAGEIEGQGATEKEAWTRHLPACPQQGKQVLADFTPSHLRLAPLPPGTLAVADRLGSSLVRARGFKEGGRELLDVASKLQQFYGTQSSKAITFLILLRNPMQQLQSYWHIRPQLPAPATFEDGVQMILANQKAKPQKIDDWFWASLYSWGVRHWLEEFDAQQFVISLTGNYLSNRRPTCKALAERWGAQAEMNCDFDVSVKLNPSSHPPLESELSADLYNELQSIYDADRQKLVDILASAQMKGATLMQYTGQIGNATAIDAWLQSGW